MSASDDHHRSHVARHMFERVISFYLLVTHEDELSGKKVEVLDRPGEPTFEFFKGGNPTPNNFLAHTFDIVRTLLELSGAHGDELFSGESGIGRRGEIGSFVEVERKEGLDAMYHIVGRHSGCFGDGDTFGPEDGWCDFNPLLLVAIRSLQE